jgi:hypothetical protein
MHILVGFFPLKNPDVPETGYVHDGVRTAVHIEQVDSKGVFVNLSRKIDPFYVVEVNHAMMIRLYPHTRFSISPTREPEKRTGFKMRFTLVPDATVRQSHI